ncbi:MAG: hypothetical protein PHV59_10780 [Victivallales bacterium]|nr:hypothetical protein [Victivallales bacterium]
MNMKVKTVIALTVLAMLNIFYGYGLRADEKTGREIKEVLGDLTRELNTAREKVATIEQERQAKQESVRKNLLPERAKALKELEALSARYQEAGVPEVKTQLAKEIESKILKTSELGTDFVESMKNDLMYQDKQLAIIQETLSGVILKMDKLAGLTAKNGNNISDEGVRLRARKSLQNLARMVEVFAARHRNKQQWGAIRHTILLQDRLLRHKSLENDKIQLMLNNQQKLYEQVLAQVIVARQGLQAEKQTLLQITVGDLAKFILRKTANLHLGNQSILKIGKIAFQDSLQRQRQLENYMNQDQDIGLTLDSGENVQAASAEVPANYQKYLEHTIN